MKYLHFCCYLLLGVCCVQFVQAQTYGNEWIDYSKTYYKFEVEENGLYRIPYSTLEAQGLPLGTTNGYKIFHKGEEVPIYLSSDGAFQPGDYIELYAEKNDGTYDTQLFTDPDWQVTDLKSLFTDVGSYYLVWDATTPGQRFETINNDITNVPPKEQYFIHTEAKVIAEAFFDGEPDTRTLAGVNSYLSSFNKSEGFISSLIIPDVLKEVDMDTKSVYSDPNQEASVELKMIGRSNNLYIASGDHHVRLSVNGDEFIDDVYEGYDTKTYTFNTDLSQLSTTTIIGIESVGDVYSPEQPNYVDKNSVGYVKITYPRTYDFGNDKFEKFKIFNDQVRYLEFENFGGGLFPVMYDLTHKKRIVPIDEDGIFKVRLTPQDGGAFQRELYVSNTTSPEAITSISNLEPKQFTDFSNPAFAADYLMLTHPRLFEYYDGENQVQRYKAYRSSPEGGSYKPLIVDITEVYDQFSYGIKQHPQAIRNFINFAVDLHEEGVWSVEPTYLFLLGKSIGYRYCTPSPLVFEDNLVPTYGMNGSDILLSSRSIYTYQNQLATGRVSAKNPEDVKEYLDKVMEYEEVVNADHPCTVEDRKWLKDVLQVAAGFNSSEETEFRGYLEEYEKIIEEVNFGGNVVATVSNGTNIVQTAPVEEYINDGLALVTFVGHSNGTFWQYGLEYPEYYNNEGKYPFVLSSSCFVGDIHQQFPDDEDKIIMAERFTLAQNKGSIGFLASVKFGFPSFLDQYTSELIQNFSKDLYGEPVSLAIRQTIENIYTDEEIGTIITCEEFTLSADPAITLYHFDNPEYIVETSGISFEPAELSASFDSVTLNVRVLNVGKAVEDSMTIIVEQEFPDGTIGNITQHLVPSPAYDEMYSIRIPIANLDNADPIGNNSFTITIDGENIIEEDCENNNIAIKDQLIIPTTAIPIAPCAFSIVGEQGVTVKASSPSLIGEEVEYLFEMDTTIYFNSPSLKIETVTSLGGVVSWTPNQLYANKVVYYWRVALKPEPDEDPSWQSSSFIYINGEESGWNQSHYFQFAQNTYEQGYLNESTREYEYDNIYSTLYCSNKHVDGDYTDGAENIIFSLNEVEIGNIACLNLPSSYECAGGLAIAVLSPTTLVPWESYLDEGSITPCEGIGPFGNVHCSNSIRSVFYFPTNTAERLETLDAFLDMIPDGYYVLAYSINDHKLNNPALASELANVHDFFGGMGITNFTDINESTFIALGKKNLPNYEFEFEHTPIQGEVIEINIPIASKTDEGSYFTRKIGPAKEWNLMRWEYESLDGNDFDQMSVDVYGINKDNETVFRFNTANELELGLDISADEYPFILLKALTKDTVNLTPPQLSHWRILYDGYPEASFNQNIAYSFLSDTLIEGELGTFTMGVTNVSDIDMDSILVHYITINNNNEEDTVAVYYDPLLADTSVIVTYNFPTAGLDGDCYFRAILNPGNNQPEKIDFNNQIVIPFFVIKDKVNPFMDVTFDGDHIMEGDIVSTAPQIDIRIKDDSPYLPLDETTANVYLIYPDLTEVEVDLSADDVVFKLPSQEDLDNNNNTATISFSPEFLQEGTHTLLVTSRDKTGNESGVYEYRVAFEVIQQAMISNVVNYPNPFTTSTRFVFTLTGTEVPENLKIQIMNISGVVVKEITRAELGDLRIGKNITDYAWDGFDTFGNELANGVYFYRVVASINNEELELFTNEAGVDGEVKYNMSSTKNLDETFKNGIGKMYKLR